MERSELMRPLLPQFQIWWLKEGSSSSTEALKSVSWGTLERLLHSHQGKYGPGSLNGKTNFIVLKIVEFVYFGRSVFNWNVSMILKQFRTRWWKYPNACNVSEYCTLTHIRMYRLYTYGSMVAKCAQHIRNVKVCWNVHRSNANCYYIFLFTNNLRFMNNFYILCTLIFPFPCEKIPVESVGGPMFNV